MSELAEVALGAAYVLLALIVLIVAKIVRDIITPYRLDEELTEKDNHAVGLGVTGYYAAVMIIFLGASAGPEPDEMPPVLDLFKDMAVVLGYTLGGVLAVVYSKYDLGCGWEEIEHPYSRGITSSDALKLGMNTIVYAMTH